MYVYMYVYMYVSMYVYMYVYMYIYMVTDRIMGKKSDLGARLSPCFP